MSGPFFVKHYCSEERPVIKGCGFDGLEIGETREEAEEFVAYINKFLGQPKQDERKEFEEWIRVEHGKGVLSEYELNIAWAAWQARGERK